MHNKYGALLKSGFVIFIGINMLAGCTTYTYKFADGSSCYNYLGLTKITEPPSISPNDDFKVVDIETCGIRLANGFGVGYFHERLESIPMDCRIVIRVKNMEQFKMAKEILLQIGKEDVCVTLDKSR